MNAPHARTHKYYLLAGIVIGMACSYYLPHEPAYAGSVDRSSKFAMCTVETFAANSEAIFVLDFVTGRLVGAAHNTQTGTFTQTWMRNLAADFGVLDDAQYVMVPGFLAVGATAGGTPARGGIYVGELNSGLVYCYGFTYSQGQRPVPTQPLVVVGSFPFRDIIN